MRIAFLTPEFPSELPNAGGLATYVHRMAQLLQQFGHEPEVFVTVAGESRTISYEGVTVHRVGRDRGHRIMRIGSQLSHRLLPSVTLNRLLEFLLRAHALARALELRHARASFDLVQSSDYLATGLFVRHRPDRFHAVRCSSATDLYNKIDGQHSSFETARAYLERLAMRRANLAYTPSRYLARHFLNVHNMDVSVIRPPVHIDTPQVASVPFELPHRFFIHFGLLMKRKGTALLAEALPLAWKAVPDLKMVWCGKCFDRSSLEKWCSLWGERAAQVQITGPLPRSQLYAVLRKAEVAVLPSQVDNLPNTVIESLSLGIPVLGSRGASIDELIDEGVTGHLVELGDVEQLAGMLVRMWRKELPVSKGFIWKSAIQQEMKPELAVKHLLKLSPVFGAQNDLVFDKGSAAPLEPCP